MHSWVEYSNSKPEDERTAAASIASVTVIVATFGRGEVLADTIESLARCPYPRFRMMIVDQTPSYEDEVADRLERLRGQHDLRYLALPVASIPLARNVGLREADGEIVLFVDDDIVAHQNLIARHVECYEDPRVGAVAGRVFDRRQGRTSGELCASSRERPGRILPDGTAVGRFFLGTRGEVAWGRGCNMSFRRSALEHVGGFDERYTATAYNEEIDVFVRIRRAGFRAVFEPDAVVDHLMAAHGGSRNGRLAQFERRRASIIRCNTLFLLRLFEETPIRAFVVAGRRAAGASVRGVRELRRRNPGANADGEGEPSRLRGIRSFFTFLSAHVDGMLAFYFERSDRLSRSLQRRGLSVQERVPGARQTTGFAVPASVTARVTDDEPPHGPARLNNSGAIR